MIDANDDRCTSLAKWALCLINAAEKSTKPNRTARNVRAACLSPFRDAPKSLAAVGEVNAHGGAGGVRILTVNGVQNFLVFAIDAIKVGAFILLGDLRRIDARVRNYCGSDMTHQLKKCGFCVASAIAR